MQLFRNIAEDVPTVNVDRVDYILILIDLTQEDSMWLLDQALQQMNIRFLVKKLAIVVTKSEKLNTFTFDKLINNFLSGPNHAKRNRNPSNSKHT